MPRKRTVDLIEEKSFTSNQSSPNSAHQTQRRTPAHSSEEDSADELNLTPTAQRKTSRILHTRGRVSRKHVLASPGPKRTSTKSLQSVTNAGAPKENATLSQTLFRGAFSPEDTSSTPSRTQRQAQSQSSATKRASIDEDHPFSTFRNTGQRSASDVVDPWPITRQPAEHLIRSTNDARIASNTPSRPQNGHRRNSPAEIGNEDLTLASPTKRRKRAYTQDDRPSKSIIDMGTLSACLSSNLPSYLNPCLDRQKRAILRAIHGSPEIMTGDDGLSASDVASNQLKDLLTGTIIRGEGNSCLIAGPRGSGKTRLVEECISGFPETAFVLRLSAWTQPTDRLAMREIAFQLGQWTGTSFFTNVEELESGTCSDESPVNPFLEKRSVANTTGVHFPSASHLPALISTLPMLSRPTIVVLDGFDLYSFHPRQSLLYCLLDTVQSCRANANNKGIAVIGITSRVESVTLLEKRVKSRFSGRIITTAGGDKLRDWVATSKNILCTQIMADLDRVVEPVIANEWQNAWKNAVNNFFKDQMVLDALNESFGISRDIRLLHRILAAMTVLLSPKSPIPTFSLLSAALSSQRMRPQFPFLHTLSYPAICLVIASVQAMMAGHDVFTFEMLYEYFCDQVRASTAAPVQVNGGSIGMMRCSRQVLSGAFEHLVLTRIFTATGPSSSHVTRDFDKYRCAVDRDVVRKAVEKMGQVNLKKWLTKS